MAILLKKKLVVKNALSSVGVQLVNMALPLLSLPYLAAMLGAERLGKMAFALAVAQIFVMLSDYGFNLSATKLISINRHDRQKVFEIWSAITFVRVIFAIVCFLMISLGALVSARIEQEFLLFAIAYCLVVGNILLPQWLYQGLEIMTGVNLAQLGVRLLTFGGVFILVKSENDLYWATGLQAVGPLLTGLFTLPITVSVLKGSNLKWPSAALIRDQLGTGWNIFVSTISINIYTTSNTFFLGLFASPVTVGYYHVADRLVRSVLALYSPISSAIYPYTSNLGHNRGGELIKFNRGISAYFIPTAGLISSIVYFTAYPFVRVLFGIEFEPAAEIVQILAWLPIIIICSNILGIQTMLPLGMDRQFSRVLLLAALIDMVAFLPASYQWGAVGAAWTNIAIELFVTLILAIGLHRAGLSPLTSKLVQN
jgi:PST family polysaccharide transporter